MCHLFTRFERLGTHARRKPEPRQAMIGRHQCVCDGAFQRFDSRREHKGRTARRMNCHSITLHPLANTNGQTP